MVTIKDIAKLAGVSHTTVSRALNGSETVKPATREMILRIAQEQNYVTNYSAKSLVHQRSFTIGLFFSSIDHGTTASFLVEAIKSVNAVLGGEYNISVTGLDTLEHYLSVNSQRYDGIILMSQSDSDDPFIHHVMAQGIPLVVLNRQLDESGILNVAANDRSGVEYAVTHAISAGHRRIGYIGGKPTFRSCKERLQGYLNAMERHGLPVELDLMRDGDYTFQSGHRAMGELLSLSMRPTCVYCANDDIAVGAIAACHAAGVSIPEDISVLGFDDNPFAAYTTPPLTTVHKPLDQIGRFGAQQLRAMLNGEQVELRQYLIETELVERDSLASPGKRR